MTEKKIQRVTLNASGVISPLFKVLKECTNSILFGLQATEIVKDIPPELVIEEGFFRMQFDQDDADIDIKKQNFKNWLVRKGFEDLVKGIEYSLREAYFYVSIVSKASDLKTGEAFNQALAEIRRKALRMHIPDMIDKIEPHLTHSLNYKDQILSINKGRTCLVHRGGLVTEKDINDPSNNMLKLCWVKLKLFYEKDGEEIELQGQTLIEGGSSIKMRRENSEISFNLGEHISLNYRQFNEFIVTCHHFGTDLVDALPKVIS